MKEIWTNSRSRVMAAVAATTLAFCASAIGTAQAAFGPIGSDFRISNTGPEGGERDASSDSAIANNPKANNYLVVWSADGLATDDEFEIFGRLLSPSGAQLGSAFRISNTGPEGGERDAAEPAVAYNSAANEYLVSWQADGLATDGEFEIFAQRLSADGTELGSDFQISTTGADGDATRDAFRSAVAYNSAANEYLVSWQADGLATDEEFEIFGQRLSASGTELGSDFQISNTLKDGNPERSAIRPSVAYNSVANEYLVSWDAQGLVTVGKREIFGQRLSASGAELGSDFRISTTGAGEDPERDASQSAVAYNSAANEYLVTWRADGLATDEDLEIFAQRLSANGTELGSDFRISTTGVDGDPNRRTAQPAAAYDPTANEYLVTWEADGLATDNEVEIFGQGLSAGGTELGSDFRISNIGTDGDRNRSAFEPEVAYNPAANEYLVVLQANALADEDEFEIFGHRVGELPLAKPPSPSNKFKFLKLVLNKKRGTATLLVQVPGPGGLILKGKGLRNTKRSAKAAGKLKLPVKPIGKAKLKLAKRGVLKLRARVTFTPTGGTAATKVKVLPLRKTVVKAKRGHRRSGSAPKGRRQR